MNDELSNIVTRYKAQKNMLAEIDSDMNSMAANIENLKTERIQAIDRINEIKIQLQEDDKDKFFFKKKGLSLNELLALKNEQDEKAAKIENITAEIPKLTETLDSFKPVRSGQGRILQDIVESYYKFKYFEAMELLSDACLNELRDFVLALVPGHPHKRLGLGLEGCYVLIGADLVKKMFGTDTPDVFEVMAKSKSILEELTSDKEPLDEAA